MRHKLTLIAILLFVIMIITGCGKHGILLEESTTAGDVISEGTYNDSWKSKGFQKPKVRDAQTVMNEASFYELACEEIKNSVKSSMIDAIAYDYTLNQRIIIISYTESGQKKYLMEKSTPGQKKTAKTQLFTEDNSIKGNVICLDCVTENDMAGLVEDGQHYTLFHMDGQGQVTSKIDVTDTYTKQKVTDTLGRTFWWCDEKGNQYVLNEERNVLSIFDISGNYIRARESGYQETYSTAFHTPLGELILVLDDQGADETRLIWLNTENGSTEELSTIQKSYLTHFQMQENGRLLYSDSSFLWMWDIATGDNIALFNYLGSDILSERYDNVEHVVLTDENTIYLYTKGTFQNGILYSLSNVEQETEEGIVLLDMIGEMYVKSCTVGFNKENPDSFITYKKATGSEETEWAKLMGQFSQGKGPDIICMFTNNMSLESLYAKGILADLGQLIEREKLELIFPGILAAGQVNGEQVGLGIQTAVWLYATSINTWNEKQWTTDDVLSLIERNPSLEGILVHSSGVKDSTETLRFLLGDLRNSPFIDWQKNESHFDDSRFIKVLQYSLKYGNGKEPASDVLDLVKEGKYIATFSTIFEEQSFFYMMDEYGYDFNLLGRTGQQGWAGYLNSCYLIVVNKNSKHMDQISKYLNYLLEQENDSHQIGFAFSRMDIMEEKYRNYIINRLPDDSKLEYSVQFYIDTMKQVGPSITGQFDLSGMIEKEAKEYFEGKKSAEDVARIIDNRVQLYLNERK